MPTVLFLYGEARFQRGNVPSPLPPCLGTRNNPCAGMGQFSSPVLSFACPLRLPNRTSIPKVPRRAQAWKGDLKRKLRGLQAAVFAKPRSCLATPQEVTVIVAGERKNAPLPVGSDGAGEGRLRLHAESRGRVCESRPSFSGTRTRLGTEYAGQRRV